ncbi:hypothetical protein RRG08_013132 [Elysia crispata]|uniref:Uncharacterized protein n=1 Tax=Elysia crispata TaxID=231223 RepID=A0AAE1A059_9GAST|nr:hypothetical protein RRG08_013132 [Elysia crispata]
MQHILRRLVRGLVTQPDGNRCSLSETLEMQNLEIVDLGSPHASCRRLSSLGVTRQPASSDTDSSSCHVAFGQWLTGPVVFDRPLMDIRCYAGLGPGELIGDTSALHLALIMLGCLV